MTLDIPRSVGKLAEALAAFQAEMPIIAKAHTAKVPTKAGGSYSYTYAGLADVSAAAMPLLGKHGLAFVTAPRRAEYGLELVGHLLHISGESIEGALPIGGNGPQEIGSAITYARRYLLGAMTGIVTDDDDDGSIAQQAAKRPAAKKAAAQPPDPDPPPAYDTGGHPIDTSGPMQPKTRARMFALFGKQGIEDRDEQIRGISHIITRPITSRGSLTENEAKRVIAKLEEREKAGASA